MVRIFNPNITRDGYVKNGSLLFQSDISQVDENERDRSVYKEDLIQRDFVDFIPAANLTWDVEAMPYAQITPDQSVTFDGMSNGVTNGVYRLMIIGNNQSISFGSNFNFVNGELDGTIPTGEKVIILFVYFSSSNISGIVIYNSKNFKLESSNDPSMTISSLSAGKSSLSSDMPGINLMAQGMDTTQKYGVGVKFLSTDTNFTTQNPKLLAGIFPRATEGYDGDTKGGMAIDVFTTPNTPGANPIPTKRVTFDHNGYVGINIENPTYRFHLIEDSSNYCARISNGTNGYGLFITAGSTSSHPIILARNFNSEAVLDVRATGNIGFGVENPSYPIHIRKTLNGSIIRIENLADGNAIDSYINFGHKNSSGSLVTAALINAHRVSDTAGTETCSLRFQTMLSGSRIETFRITNSGISIGSGGFDAQAPIHVKSDNISSGGSLSGQIFLQDTADYNQAPTSGMSVAAKYTSGGGVATMGGWTVSKENAVDGDYSSRFSIHTRLNGQSPEEAVRISSSKTMTVYGNINTSGGGVNVQQDNATLNLYDTANGNYHYFFQNIGGAFKFVDNIAGGDRYEINSAGNMRFGSSGSANLGGHSRSINIAALGTNQRAALEINGTSSGTNGALEFYNNSTLAAQIKNRDIGASGFVTITHNSNDCMVFQNGASWAPSYLSVGGTAAASTRKFEVYSENATEGTTGGIAQFQKNVASNYPITRFIQRGSGGNSGDYQGVVVDVQGTSLAQSLTCLNNGNEELLALYLNGQLDMYRLSASSADEICRMYSNYNSTKSAKILFRSNGDILSATGSYGTISDRRLKENEKPARNYTDDFKKLKFYTYNLIGSDQKQFGLMADEVKEIFPSLVTEYVSETFEEIEVEHINEQTGLTEKTKKQVVTETNTYEAIKSILKDIHMKVTLEIIERLENLEKQLGDN